MIKSKKCYTLNKINFTLFILIVLCVSPEMLHAQINNYNPEFYYQKSLTLQKNGMLILGSWAMMNILSGSYGVLRSNGDTKYFHQMNAAWNIVNLGIAFAGYYGASSGAELSLTDQGMLDEVSHLNRILLINAGLDLLYIGTGIVLWKNGISGTSDRKMGYGKSILIQGSFLLVFDTVLYLINQKYSEGFLKINDTISFLPNGFRINF